jgi:hypothetical protein
MLFSVSSALAQAGERELMNIRIWRTYKDVLEKYGRPTRIEVGEVAGATGTGSGNGGGMAGGGMMGGAPGMMGSGGMMSGRMGLPGMGGMGMMGSTGMMGMMGGGGMSSGAAILGRPDGGGTGRGRMGMPGKGAEDIDGGMPGAGGMMGGAEQQTSTEGEVTWVYERGPLTFMFLFNKDGRIIQIQAYGHKGPAVTSKGITLGSTVDQIYSKYGWSAKQFRVGSSLALDFSEKHHVAFQLAGYGGKPMKVVGIVVAMTERGGPGGAFAPPGLPPGAPAGGGAGAGGGMMGGAPGMMGSGGMMGMMGGGPRGRMGSGGGMGGISILTPTNAGGGAGAGGK